MSVLSLLAHSARGMVEYHVIITNGRQGMDSAGRLNRGLFS